jgi:quinohemoprotein ethanol dehydrogenase
MLVPNGMPRFEELSEMERENLRQYIRTRANELRKAGKATS